MATLYDKFFLMQNTDKITITWLKDHVPVKLWMTAFGFIAATFLAGISFSKWENIEIWLENLTSNEISNNIIDDLQEQLKDKENQLLALDIRLKKLKPFRFTEEDVEKLAESNATEMQQLIDENKKLRTEIDTLKTRLHSSTKILEERVSDIEKESVSEFADKLVGAWSGSHSAGALTTITEYYYYMTFTPDYRISASWIDDGFVDCAFTENKQVLSVTCPDEKSYKITVLMKSNSKITVLYQNLARVLSRDS